MKRYFTLILLAFVAFSCTKNASYKTIEGFLEGTTYRVTYADAKGRDLRDTIENLIHRFERSLSIYDSTSLLIRLNTNQTAVVDGWFTECFNHYKDIYTPSDSLLDPTLRPLIAIYGFGGKNSKPRSPSDMEIDSIMEFVGLHKISLSGDILVKDDPRTELDFNALAKGYSVDLVAEMLASMGVDNFMVEIGGEIVTQGVSPKGGVWRIGIDAPIVGNNTPGQNMQTVMELSGRGLATSGNYRKGAVDQNGIRVTHTIDPRTGRPAVHNLLSATILAPSCAVADGYATAAMVGGLEWTKQLLATHSELDGILIYADPMGEFKVYSTVDLAK